MVFVCLRRRARLLHQMGMFAWLKTVILIKLDEN